MNKPNQKPSKGPEFIRFFKPVLEVLAELGGSGSAGEVIDAVIERMNISEAEFAGTLKDGTSRIKNQIAWARFYLSKVGALSSSERGVWALTETGEKIQIKDHSDTLKLFAKAREVFGVPKKNMDSENEDLENTSDSAPVNSSSDHYKQQLIQILRNLTPAGFERISQRLLRENGFKRVEVKGRSGDGGIDGEGILEINPLMSFKALFQCKKYAADVSVGAGAIRDFRGAMQGRADKGIFITTSYFTKDARKEAVRDGVPPIELVDGDNLAELFIKAKMGLKPVTVYEVDYTFFTEYQNDK